MSEKTVKEHDECVREFIINMKWQNKTFWKFQSNSERGSKGRGMSKTEVNYDWLQGKMITQ